MGIRRAVGVLDATVRRNLQVLAHIEIGSLIGLAVKSEHAFRGDFHFGLHGERELLIIKRQAERRSKRAEDKPLADREVLAASAHYLVEFERTFAIPQTQGLGFLLQVLAVHEMVGIVEIDGTDARNVGRDAHMVVGNPLGSPDGTGFARARSIDLELPHFVGIGHGQTLAPVGITVFLSHLPHQADGIAGVVAILQGQALKFLDPEHAIAIDQVLVAVVGRLANGQLLLIHAGIRSVDETIGLQSRRHDAARLINAPHVPGFFLVEDIEEIRFRLTRGKGLAGLDGHESPVIGIAAVGGHHRPVGRSLFAYHDGGAGISRRHGAQQQRGCSDPASIEQFHVAVVYGF